MLCGCRSLLGFEESRVDDKLANDEDGDTIFDFEDNCPTVANTDQADSDADDVGTACDPSGVQNRIAFYSPLLDDEGLDLGPNTAIGDGFAAIRSSQISVTVARTPVRIEAKLAFRTFAASQTLTLEHDAGIKGTWSCFAGFKIGACASVDCLRFQVPNATIMSTNFDEAETLSKLTIEILSTGAATCTGDGTSTPKSLAVIGPGPSLGTVTVSATGDAELYSLIVYE